MKWNTQGKEGKVRQGWQIESQMCSIQQHGVSILPCHPRKLHINTSQYLYITRVRMCQLTLPYLRHDLALFAPR
jgi:hypothetical protein